MYMQFLKCPFETIGVVTLCFLCQLALILILWTRQGKHTITTGNTNLTLTLTISHYLPNLINEKTVAFFVLRL